MFFKTNKRLSWFHKSLLVINIIITILLLICYVTPYFDPISYPLVSVCGLFYLFLYILNVCCVAYWLFRRSFISVPFLICLLPGISHVNLHYGFKRNIELYPKALGAIRLMTYNLNSFNGIDQTSSQKRIMELTDSLQPDVLSLQELSSRVHGKGAIIDSFKTVMRSKYYTKTVFIISNTDTTESAIFSKLL